MNTKPPLPMRRGIVSFGIGTIVNCNVETLYHRIVPSMLYEGELRYRSLNEFKMIAPHLTVIFINEEIIGTYGLLPYGNTAELIMLWVSGIYRQGGFARRMIRWAIQDAEQQGYRTIFACTTSKRVRKIFGKAGMRRTSPNTVPPEKWINYPPDRKPFVMIRVLQKKGLDNG